MLKPIGPFQAVDTYLHLGPEGSAVPLEVNASFWDDLTSGAFAHLGPGRLVSTYDFNEDWGGWERHPAGEEVVLLLTGALEFVLETEAGPRKVELKQPGQFLLVPRGTWHTANVAQHARVLFITPGEGTEHRPRAT
ncbi:cupin domain-containing protein [Pseudoduganella violaceinigra]|uniref:cupin domain-containing protein n=1 Tax=Pseudoduganella violaceinigra TaxID=246602 RepID=UPI0003FF5603|nr:cupin domain-containing protein [Pseudoduganella violaceinigra]